MNLLICNSTTTAFNKLTTTLFVLLISLGALAQVSPLSLKNPSLTGQNLNWNYNMGYSFTPNVDGDVTELGGLWRSGVTHTVRLYNQNTGAVLATTNVTGTGSWNYATLASAVSVTAGTSYVVAVRLNSQSSGAYTNASTISMPFSSGAVTVNHCRYSFGTNAMPTTTITSAMYGMADIVFTPCVYAGNLSADATEVISGNGTTLTALDNVGSIQWQSSNDGVNFTDVLGATGVTLNTGNLIQKTHYRTRTTSGGCGQDSSAVIAIDIIDPLYPLRIQDPAVTGQNINWNYNMGYRFTALKDGQITELGGRWRDGINHTVRLYSYPSGTLLASTNVTGSMNWAYASITPVSITTGSQYVVAVRLNSQSSASYASGFGMPVNTGGIQITNSTYLNASNSMPTNSITTTMYGVADVRFEPCDYAGLIAGNTSVAKWDSTTLNLVDPSGTVQWQKSTDGTNFTDISGATGNSFNTGALGVSTYFRTRMLTPTCTGDTSEVHVINVINPGYPLQLQNPGVTGQNINWNYNMGYRFTANSDGLVSELGGKWRGGITHTVRLYAYPAGTILATANVTANGEWNYQSITPVALTAGNQYVVAVRLNSQSSGQYGSMTLPATSGQITINNSCYLNGSNAMPTNAVTTTMYGFADLKFEPCVFSGTVSATDSLICSGSVTQLEVVNAEGSIQWQISSNGSTFTDISGATDTVYFTDPLTTARYYRMIATSGCGSDTSAIVPITIIGGGQNGLWTGLVDNDWMNGCNWASGLAPAGGDSVFIPFGTTPPTNNPLISLVYLEINNTSNFSLSNAMEITGALKLSTGNIVLGNSNLTLGASCVIEGGQSTSYLDASGAGEVRRAFTATGSTTVPLGGNSQYTPVDFTLNGSSSVGLGAYVSFRSIDLNHPSIGTPSNRITRYWIIGGNNITALNYNASFNYADLDIVGNENLVVTRFLNNASQWSSYATAVAATNTLVANGVTEYGDFTGGDDLPFQSAQTGNWNDPATWVGGVVPGATNDVSILSTHTVTLTGTESARSVSVNSGGGLTLNANQLNIGGNAVNYGTFDGTGTINMDGATSQEITGIWSFDILRIDNASGVSVNVGTIEVTRRLEIEAGNFNTDNSMTLISNPTRTASISEIKGSLTGEVTVQRHIPATTNVAYRHLSSPMENSTLSDYLYDPGTYLGGIYMYGFPGSNNPAITYASSYTFNENLAGTSGNWNDGWEASTDISNSNTYLSPMAYYMGGPNFTSYDLVVTGTVNTGTKALTNLSMTGATGSTGWHMMGNPYPSAIDWSAVSKSGIDATAYIFTNGGWTPSSLISEEIASFQAFFIHVNNATNSLTFEENDKSNTDAPFRKSKKVVDRLKFNLENVANKQSTLAALDFNNQATDNFDADFDAYIIGNYAGVPDFGFFDVNGTRLQVNAVPVDEAYKVYPIYFRGNANGTFKLSIVEYPKSVNCIQLFDKKTGKTIALGKDSTFTFQSNSLADTSRFELLLSTPLLQATATDAACFESNDGKINVPVTLGWNNTLFDATGTEIPLNGTVHTQTADELTPGIYKVIAESADQSCTEQVKYLTILQPDEIISTFSYQETVSRTVEFQNESSNGTTYEWNFGDGATSTDENPIHEYKDWGEYEVELIATTEQCSNQYKRVIAIAPPSSVEYVNQQQLATVFATGEQIWIRNDIALSNVQLTVYAIDGKKVLESNFEEMPAGKTQLGELSTSFGTLIIALNSDQVNINTKLIR